MDMFNDILSPEVQAVILQVLVLLSAAMPILEKIVAKTATEVDDKALDVLKRILGMVPRVRLGGK
jgi:hypothetical protein